MSFEDSQIESTDQPSEYTNKEGIPQDLSVSFQRKYSTKLHFRKSSWINFFVLFNKTNTNMRFFIPDAKDLMNHGIYFKYYKNIMMSPFFSKELKLVSLVGDRFNIVSQFDGIKNQNKIKLISNETITLGIIKPADRNVEFKQTCTVYIFSDTTLPERSSYYVLVERQHNSLEDEKKFVRTSGLEIYDTTVLTNLKPQE